MRERSVRQLFAGSHACMHAQGVCANMGVLWSGELQHGAAACLSKPHKEQVDRRLVLVRCSGLDACAQWRGMRLSLVDGSLCCTSPFAQCMSDIHVHTSACTVLICRKYCTASRDHLVAYIELAGALSC